ncbi:MAG: transglycosylase domain-containing protein, partial [Rhizobium sp.]|nr:transglycosylase domain-containing protein [Rhizobium sp.]
MRGGHGPFLAQPRRRKAARRGLRWRRWAAGLALALLALFALDRLFPPPLPGAGGATVMLAADGTPLRAFADRDGVWRYPVTPDQVSPYYLEALLGYEDRWFQRHPGVNPLALARAAWQWATSGRGVCGGSTRPKEVARLRPPRPAGGRPGRRAPDR